IFFLYVALVTFAGYLDSEFSTKIITIILLISSVYFLYIRKDELKITLYVNKDFTLVTSLALASALLGILLTHKEEYTEYYGTLYNMNPTNMLLMCIVYPVAEEIVFRLYWLKYLSHKLSNTKSIVIVSLGFSIYHLFSGIPLLYAFLYSIIISWLYLRFKKLYLCFLFHIVYNTSVLLIYTAIQNIEFTSQIRGIGLLAAATIIVLSLRQLYLTPKAL